jgi:hypothetical protein
MPSDATYPQLTIYGRVGNIRICHPRSYTLAQAQTPGRIVLKQLNGNTDTRHKTLCDIVLNDMKTHITNKRPHKLQRIRQSRLNYNKHDKGH